MLITQRARGPSSDDDEAQDNDALVSKLEEGPKNVHADSRGCTQMISLRRTVALVAVLAIVVDPPFVLYFFVVIAATVAIAARQAKAEERPRALYVWAKAVAFVVIAVSLLQFLRQFEIEPIGHDFDMSVISADKSSSAVTFFRMYNPRVTFYEDIERIHSHVNGGAVATKRLPIPSSVNVWASDVLRYDFLQQVWQQSAASDGAYRVVCLAESDMVYDERYISSLLATTSAKEPLELAHVQHFWGHRVFEPFNIALLCTSTHASPWTRRWATLAGFLHRKRYRRLLPLHLLYALVPKRTVLYWDAHHGCTEYHARCKYIHFTLPKLEAIDDALRVIKQSSGTTAA